MSSGAHNDQKCVLASAMILTAAMSYKVLPWKALLSPGGVLGQAINLLTLHCASVALSVWVRCFL